MITVDHITKTYGTFTAVDDVTFTARPGRITGFLGPNGAGKSTTLRVVVGLTPPDHGTAHVLGRRFRDLPNPGLEVGVLLDASAQHTGRTGREVLTIAQRTMGLPRARVEEVLDLVQQVRGQQHGRATVGIAAQQVSHPPDAGRVEPVGRLVEHEHLRIAE